MTVAELIAALQTLPPESIVVQSRDREGNSYKPCDAIEAAWWDPQSWQPYPKGQPAPDAVRAVIFWPAS